MWENRELSKNEYIKSEKCDIVKHIEPSVKAVLKRLVACPIIRDYNSSGLPIWIIYADYEKRNRILYGAIKAIRQSSRELDLNLNVLYFKTLNGIVYLKMHTCPEQQMIFDFTEVRDNGTICDFRQKYADTDFLFVDNAESIPLHSLIEDEFFKMYCHMTARDKPVVIAADKSFRDISFNVRLMTRFEIGTEITL